MRHRPPLAVMAALLLAFAWAFWLGWITRHIRVATEDDLFGLAIRASPGALRSAVLTEAIDGRIYGPVKWNGLRLYYSLAAPAALGLARGGLNVAMMAVTGLVLWRFTCSAVATALGLLIFGALSSLHYGYQPLLSNPLLLIGAMSANLAILLLRPDGRSPIPAWIAFTCALAMHEDFLMWLPLLAWAACSGQQPARARSRLAPFLVIAGTYLGLYLWVRHQGVATGRVYSGTELAPALKSSVEALWRYSISSLSPLRIFSRMFPFAATAAPLSAAEAGRRLAAQLGPGGWTAAAGTALLAVRLWWVAPPRRIKFPLGLGAAMLFLPNLPIALTGRYQAWAHLHRFPYYYSSLGLTWVALSLAAAATAGRPQALGRRILLGLALALGLFWSSATAISLTYEALADFSRQSYG